MNSFLERARENREEAHLVHDMIDIYERMVSEDIYREKDLSESHPEILGFAEELGYEGNQTGSSVMAWMQPEIAKRAVEVRTDADEICSEMYGLLPEDERREVFDVLMDNEYNELRDGYNFGSHTHLQAYRRAKEFNEDSDHPFDNSLAEAVESFEQSQDIDNLNSIRGSEHLN